MEQLKVGQVLYSSWGYDQTNIDYVKVVSLSPSGKTVKLVRIGQKMVKGSEGFMSESVLPDVDNVTGDEFRGYLRFDKESNELSYVKAGYHFFSHHDGEPDYQSHYA